MCRLFAADDDGAGTALTAGSSFWGRIKAVGAGMMSGL